MNETPPSSCSYQARAAAKSLTRMPAKTATAIALGLPRAIGAQARARLLSHLRAQDRRPPEREARGAERLARPAPEAELVDVLGDQAVAAEPEPRADVVD